MRVGSRTDKILAWNGEMEEGEIMEGNEGTKFFLYLMFGLSRRDICGRTFGLSS